MSILPPKDKTMDTMVMTKLLSARASKSLGESEFQHQFDPFAIAAENECVVTNQPRENSIPYHLLIL